MSMSFFVVVADPVKPAHGNADPNPLSSLKTIAHDQGG
jgi:hypothetical protein